MEYRATFRASSDRDITLPAVSLGFFLVLFDATAVNVATGGIGSSLGASITELQWVLDAYTVAFAAAMLGAGSLGDRFGARRLYVAGSVLFAVAAGACAVAPSAPALIAARAVQGLGAAAVVPCSLAIVADRYREGPARSRALGIWGGVSGVGLAAGPVVGGALVASAGWRTVFLVVVPLAVASAALVATRVEETSRTTARTDLPGQVLAAIALVTVAAAFTQTSTVGWTDPSTLGLAAVTVVAAAAFWRRERRAGEPMVPPALLRSHPLRGALGIGLLFNFGLYGSLFCLALVLERTLGEPADIAGLALLPLTVVVALGALLSGRLMDRLGLRGPIFLGLAGGLIGACLLAAFGTDLGAAGLAGMGAVLGMVGFAMPAMTAVALGAVGPRKAGLGAGLLNAARQAGGALGVALLGGLVAGQAVTGSPSAGSTHLTVPMLVVAGGYLGALLITALTMRRSSGWPR